MQTIRLAAEGGAVKVETNSGQIEARYLLHDRSDRRPTFQNHPPTTIAS